jgi:molybdate transport system ATP-binding protein
MLSVDVAKKLASFAVSAKFEAPDGVTALFGPSGAGKTSIVNMVAGLLTPDRGRIECDGALLFNSTTGFDAPPHQRGVGYVFQDGRLFPHMTVAQNLDYGRRMYRLPPDREERMRIVTLLDIARLLDRRPGNLSGGERQRVAIGRALLMKPRLLLLDEPLAGLSPDERKIVRDLIAAIPRETTIVMIEHDMDMALAFAERIALLHYGQLVVDGDCDAVVADPRTREVYLGA